MVDLNKKFRFISDGTWFLKGAECTVEDGDCIWMGSKEPCNTPDENWEDHEFLLKNQHRISGLFRGPTREQEDDGELCGLDEFDIVKREA
jgi:hypothetical protein